VVRQVKAKVIRSYVDKMITLAKDGSLHARRQVQGNLEAFTLECV
jgi:large subunit ribosomal protein L17